MVKTKTIVGLIAVFILVSSNIFAGDLPDKNVVVQKNVVPETQGMSATESVPVVNFNELTDYEKEMLIMEILGHWRDMDLLDRVVSIIGSLGWVGAWAGLIGLAISGGPVGWIIFGIVMFYFANFTGPVCLYRILI